MWKQVTEAITSHCFMTHPPARTDAGNVKVSTASLVLLWTWLFKHLFQAKGGKKSNMSGALLSAVLLFFFFLLSKSLLTVSKRHLQTQLYLAVKHPSQAKTKLAIGARFCNWRINHFARRPLQSLDTCVTLLRWQTRIFTLQKCWTVANVSYTKITIVTPRKVRATEYIRERF